MLSHENISDHHTTKQAKTLRCALIERTLVLTSLTFGAELVGFELVSPPGG